MENWKWCALWTSHDKYAVSIRAVSILKLLKEKLYINHTNFSNPKLLNALPSGFICTATHQTAGRGRGKNGWLSQLGALQFSLVLHHKFQLKHAPVVFIQYLMALAVVESITKRPGYEAVPLKLKWPNDIYLDTKTQGSVKVGGILVHSTFVIDTFMLVIGCGINLSNALPTVSINDVIAEEYGLQKLTNEDVLAGVLVKFEEIYKEFCENGAGPWFLNRYYDHWMHR
jgi:biotin--protein ligase